MRRIGVHVEFADSNHQEGDDVARIVVDTLMSSLREDGYELRDRMCWRSPSRWWPGRRGITSPLTRWKKALKAQFPVAEIGVVFPILSRNRFS